MLDRQLNYGRHIIRAYAARCNPLDNVLDIAAGSGTDLKLVREVAPEASLKALECYTPNIQKLEAAGIAAFDCNLERDRFPFADESLDLIIANQTLEHTKELFWIFSEVSRTIKVGGHLIVGVPNLASLHNRLLLAAGRQPSPIKSNSAHIRGFTKGDLISFAGCWPGGYRLTDCKGSNFYPFSPFIAKPLARALPTMAWGIFLLFEKARSYDGAYLRFPHEQQLETNFYVG